MRALSTSSWLLSPSLPGSLLAVLLGGLAGCGAPQPAEQPDPLQWNVLPTGRACVRARAACGVGNCAARIANHCGQPVSCELTVQCICQAMTGESVEAIERVRDTVLAGDEAGLRAQVLCSAGEVQATHAKRIHCR